MSWSFCRGSMSLSRPEKNETNRCHRSLMRGLEFEWQEANLSVKEMVTLNYYPRSPDIHACPKSILHPNGRKPADLHLYNSISPEYHQLTSNISGENVEMHKYYFWTEKDLYERYSTKGGTNNEESTHRRWVYGASWCPMPISMSRYLCYRLDHILSYAN